MKKTNNFGEWALVTGSSSGIGEEFANQLAAKGYNLVLLARRGDKLFSIADSLEKIYGIHTKVLVLDLTESDFMTKIAEGIEGIEIGLVVSNAGAAHMGAFAQLPLPHLQKMVQLNVNAQLEISHYFTNYYKENGTEGGIILVSSTTAFQGVPYGANYSAAKAYILTLGEALHQEVKGDGIHVTVLVPGPTEAPGLTDRNDADLSKMPMKPQKVDALVREGLRGIERNKPVVIGGGMSKMMVWMGKRVLNRHRNVKLWGSLMKGMVFKV